MLQSRLPSFARYASETGGPKWNCTTDPRVISTVLCSLSYRPVAPPPAGLHKRGNPGFPSYRSALALLGPPWSPFPSLGNKKTEERSTRLLRFVDSIPTPIDCEAAREEGLQPLHSTHRSPVCQPTDRTNNSWCCLSARVQGSRFVSP